MPYHFVLIVKYLSGECAFPVDTDDLQKALKEFEEAQKQSVENSVLMDKSFSLPTIVSAKIVKLFYRN